MDQQIRMRWIYGRYLSAAEAAEALVWLRDYTEGDAGLGVDYEAASEAIALDAVASKGGDPKIDARSRMIEIQKAIADGLGPLPKSERQVWLCKRTGNTSVRDSFYIGRYTDPEIRRILVAAVDAQIEIILKDRGLLK